MVSEVENGIEVLEGADLCVGCLEPVRPGSDLCSKCGAPHGALSGILPLLRVLSEGYVFRQAVQHPKSRITVIGVWIIFGAAMLPGILSLPISVSGWEWSWQGLLYFLGYGGAVLLTALLSLLGIIQTTRNFRRFESRESADHN